MSITGETGGARRRGRPQRLPEDTSPLAAPTVSSDRRVAWLLSTNRLLSPDPDHIERRTFLAALAERGVRVDSTRISRWESGTHLLTAPVVTGYESVLGLPEGRLTAVVTGVRHALDPDAAARASSVPPVDVRDADVDDLLSTLELGRGHGGQWLRLAMLLHRFDRVYLRASEWQRVTQQLLRELAGAAGAGYVRRFEAAAHLMRHPSSRRHLTRALGAYVMEPDVQVVPPVLNLLAEVREPAAGALVLRLLTDDRADLRRAAASVAATKLVRGHFEEHDLPRLEQHVVGSLRRGESLDMRLDSFDLAVQLPPHSWERIRDALRNRRSFDLVERARRSGELIPSAQSAGVVQDLAAKVQAETPAHAAFEPDQMLRRLLREALLHAHKSRRHHAALLIAASPYAPAAARGLLGLAEHPNALLAARAWSTLMRVGHHGHGDLVLSRALLDERPSIRARALVVLGLSPTPLRPDDADRLVEKSRSAKQVADRRATLYALGMHGSSWVEKVAVDETREEWVRRGARWWLDQGPARHDPDTRD